MKVQLISIAALTVLLAYSITSVMPNIILLIDISSLLWTLFFCFLHAYSFILDATELEFFLLAAYLLLLR